MKPLTINPDGWCDGASRYDSPYFDARPDGAVVDLLVIHNVSLPGGQFGGPHVSDLFTGRLDYNADPSFASLRHLEVSAHFFIRRDGRIVQYVSAHQRAWHAGVSVFRGRPHCNGYSIGIEMEGSDFVPFEPSQYRALAALTAALQAVYPLQQVCGHEHVAPGRKTDPGPFFDWPLYEKTLLQTQQQASALALTYRALGFPSML
ncbi:1,6-anhydro-N-acetylmuramyl-L-alanine amidase AmpD [Janthinobacterium agaricidamnosum]|uniref:1,6-anhydro-N-acetylmuramyl-L-alanine amidase AmpD n=1 Tax=Janthinobacterium agaricidamnosum NBRC 102515 = DSM 9628 TaxID=1349767 RepID=W0V0J2_9BURK|nr:1,6-anhydro-N-acetylmuramyl-L-alanine amidase AmpD [Janthinobacterium agaricidamnosum]CDG81391.1 N-acetylmuramoyl-L-alanine amidase family protein [Janthinobacterium agaricidamnosum NBRC 102515 = DSM 9628]